MAEKRVPLAHVCLKPLRANVMSKNSKAKNLKKEAASNQMTAPLSSTDSVASFIKQQEEDMVRRNNEFKENRKKIEERLRNGNRRTNGFIV